MKVTLTDTGAVIDAHDLGPLLGIDAASVQEKMRSGEISSQSEKGIDEDLGNHRLTFWYNGKRVRVTCDKTGTVTKTSRSDARRPVI